MAVNNSKDEITSHVLDDLVEPINRYAHVDSRSFGQTLNIYTDHPKSSNSGFRFIWIGSGLGIQPGKR